MKSKPTKSRSRSFLSKIKSPDSLRKHLKKNRKRGTQVVFTNGVFDLLHKGHVTYLEQAKKQGTELIVALNSDESVRAIKGPTRPLNLLADRMEVMAALESVDYVTWFEDQTPLDLIKKLRPDILVKGGDWKVDQMVGAAEVIGWGGKARSLPYIEGRSTTDLINRAKSGQTA